MRVVDIIMKKRDGISLGKSEINGLIEGYVAGTVADYQVAAFLMAVCLRGMSAAETAALTEAMLHSGTTIALHNTSTTYLDGPFVDKHSTGGVGDKISLPLAPIVAACGVQVPMMSGRALGHTGGTLDKLESIQGYRVDLSPDEFRVGIASDGFAMMGQTKDIVPADRLLYSLRDVTGTVESIPLITASILSKKIAEGADALVFDVKYGKGAFMKTFADSLLLADSLVDTLAQVGDRRAVAVITNMDSPLGYKVGNFLEIEETVEALSGIWSRDVKELTYELAVHMLLLAGRAESRDDAIAKIDKALSSGEALKRFYKNVDRQGGDSKKLVSEIGVRRSPHHTVLCAVKDGYITIDAMAVGLAGVTLGVGRNKTTEPVFADSGVILHVKEGEYVTKGTLLMDVYGKDDECLIPASAQLASGITYSDDKPEVPDLIAKVIVR